MKNSITFRSEVIPSDIQTIKEIVESTQFFHPEEVEIAIELIEERLHKGEKSGYHFIFAEYESSVVGYSCYGLIPCTKNRYDLHWIAVKNSFQGKTVGSLLLKKTEASIQHLHGKRIYIETSSKPLYEPTRQFYLKHGYHLDVLVPHFYDQDDDKMIFLKVLDF